MRLKDFYYYIRCEDVGVNGFELYSEGDDLTELLHNALYLWIDKKGEVFAQSPAQDEVAMKFIMNWWEENGNKENVKKPDEQYDSFIDNEPTEF